MKLKRVAFLVGVGLACSVTARGQSVSSELDPRMDWFHEAKYGMFIHWGVYAVPAGEWQGKTSHGEWIQLTGKIPNSEYKAFVDVFNPVGFDAQEWVRIAKDAGMQYMVITAKHHDGFCMYNSAFTDYDIVDATHYGRDPMVELARACREAGLRFCFYYSLVDWHHPEFPAPYSQRGFHGDPNPQADISKYADYLKNQVREGHFQLTEPVMDFPRGKGLNNLEIR